MGGAVYAAACAGVGLAELSTAIMPCMDGPLGPSNLPLGATPGLQPTIVPSSVAKRKMAGAVCVLSEILNPCPAKSWLKTEPVGVPSAPSGSSGLGILTTSGLMLTGVLFAPGTL